MSASSEREPFHLRCTGLGRFGCRSYRGTVFRFNNPEHSKANDVVSGAGGLHASGRWNLEKAFRISYTSLSPETALAEAPSHCRYYNLPLETALPRVLVGVRAELRKVLHLTDGRVRKRLQLGMKTIRHFDWRESNRRGIEAVTQVWGSVFVDAGYEAASFRVPLRLRVRI